LICRSKGRRRSTCSSTGRSPEQRELLFRQNSRSRSRYGLIKRAAANTRHLRGRELRHSASSILQALGLPPLAATEVLGHASPDVTMGIYGHLLSASRRQAAELMDGYLDQLEGPPGGAGPTSP